MNEEGWEVVDRVKPTITDGKSSTLKETKGRTNGPDLDDQWEIIVYKDTHAIHSS